MITVEDYAKLIDGTRERTIIKVGVLRKRCPNENFPTESEIREYSGPRLLEYHLKISERYHQVTG